MCAEKACLDTAAACTRWNGGVPEERPSVGGALEVSEMAGVGFVWSVAGRVGDRNCTRPRREKQRPKRAVVSGRAEGNGSAPLPQLFSWDGCPTFLQCPKCRCVFSLESEEISGEPRPVLCSTCLYAWNATEKEIIWGEDAALQSIESAPEVPIRRRPHSRKSFRDQNGMSVFVGGLSYSCTEDDLFAAFSSFGDVRQCRIPHKGSVPRGIGFVEFRNKGDALRAIEELNGMSILGRKISLSVANTDNRDFEEEDDSPYDSDATEEILDDDSFVDEETDDNYSAEEETVER
mmetsp:Transcript_12894/g.39675  ORF Transcript_12894/g.39675 Transcript_12894/m.39675 type:complete len:291 (+) Transcript_12894:151-1023(+)